MNERTRPTTLIILLQLAFGAAALPLKAWHLSRARRDQQQGGDVYSERLQAGFEALSRLLDPQEAHAALLRDGHAWFEGHWDTPGQRTSELGRSNVAQFLAYALFGHSSSAATECAKAALDSHSERLLIKASQTASGQFVAALGKATECLVLGSEIVETPSLSSRDGRTLRAQRERQVRCAH